MLMIRPPPRFFMCGKTALQQYHMALGPLSKHVSHHASSPSSSGAGPNHLCAFFTRISMPPNCSTAFSTIRLTWDSLLTSQTTPIALPPRSQICAAVASAVSRSISAITTLAPSSASAIDTPLPILLPPPVTIATRPSSFPISRPSLASDDILTFLSVKRDDSDDGRSATPAGATDRSASHAASRRRDRCARGWPHAELSRDSSGAPRGGGCERCSVG